jgi:high-affinity nickel-transport protein
MQDALSPGEWGRMGGMVATVVALHVVGFVLLFAATGHHYHLSKTQLFGIGTGLLAYTLGMRHAFDADHIAAIDNTTRKLMSEGKRPLSVGFFFSLGHSSVVFGLAVLLNFGIRSLDSQVKNGGSGLHRLTTVIGTSVSGFFLYLIAALNIVILVSIVRVFKDMRRGKYDDEELEEQLNKRGLMNRFFGKLARRIDTPWKMYPIGVLFGLGFDTATEVALLVLSGTAVASGLPFYGILWLLHELRLRVGVLEADPQGLLQHHDHRALRGRGVPDRDDRAARVAHTRAQLERSDGGVLRELQPQRRRLRHRRALRGDVGCGAGDLAFRPYRTTMG